MNRREFLASAAALATSSAWPAPAQTPPPSHTPQTAHVNPDSYIEDPPVPEYHWASQAAYDAFNDMKFGIRIHWGIYSIWHRGAESWPFLTMSLEDRQTYMSLYKTWNPAGFDADAWMDTFSESGMKMFAFTSKHHEGFSMFDTADQGEAAAPTGPPPEARRSSPATSPTPSWKPRFAAMSSRNSCDAAHKRDIKIDLYFSHPDWYDADFRPYVQHPLQIPSSAELVTPRDVREDAALL